MTLNTLLSKSPSQFVQLWPLLVSSGRLWSRTSVSHTVEMRHSLDGNKKSEGQSPQVSLTSSGAHNVFVVKATIWWSLYTRQMQPAAQLFSISIFNKKCCIQNGLDEGDIIRTLKMCIQLLPLMTCST